MTTARISSNRIIELADAGVAHIDKLADNAHKQNDALVVEQLQKQQGFWRSFLLLFAPPSPVPPREYCLYRANTDYLLKLYGDRGRLISLKALARETSQVTLSPGDMGILLYYGGNP